MIDSMKSKKYHMDMVSGKSLVQEKAMNKRMMELRIQGKEYNNYYDPDKKIATIIWND